MIADVETIRRQGIIFFTVTGWVVSITLLIASITLGENAFKAAIASAVLNLAPTYIAINRRTDQPSLVIIAIMVALQPAMLLFAMQSLTWQLDMHMYFFVALAGLIALCHTRPIIVASMVIIAHHLALSYTAPGWVFIGDGSSGRVLIHAIAVVMLGAILYKVTTRFERLLVNNASARKNADRQARMLEEQSNELQLALHRVEKERSAREEAEQARTQARREDLDRFLREFETTVAGVIHSVAATARVLEKSTKELDKIAQEAGHQATDFADKSKAASSAAKTVAQGVAELSHSIANIAVNVSQQDELTTKATERAVSGSSVVGSLTQHSDTIEEATRAIVRIAERTNLLSLNAAIEAATAGPAGRGFTIVAQEVKALATQATEAASEIDELLTGVRSGSHEAERSFSAIDEAIAELDQAAKAIRGDVEGQQRSADTIETYARNAAGEVEAMANRGRALADSASNTRALSAELDKAASALLRDIRQLEATTGQFAENLKAA